MVKKGYLMRAGGEDAKISRDINGVGKPNNSKKNNGFISKTARALRVIFKTEYENHRSNDKLDFIFYFGAALTAIIAFIVLKITGNNTYTASSAVLTVTLAYVLYKAVCLCFASYKGFKPVEEANPSADKYARSVKIKIILLYISYISIIAILYIAGILNLYLSLAIFFTLMALDRVFVYGGCWLRIWFMPKTTCCKSCVIKDWDFFLITTPLYFCFPEASTINRFLLTLLFVLCIYRVIRWENMLGKNRGVSPHYTDCVKCESSNISACPKKQ